MKTLVTGTTGFVGASVVRKLLEHGVAVKVLIRPCSDTRNIDGLDVELTYGDLRDEGSLLTALKGCDTLYHVAAHYSLWTLDSRGMFESNVLGTRRLLQAALRLGINKVVYTSSVAAIGTPDDDGQPGNEETILRPEQMIGPYKQSKYLAEVEAWKCCARGLPVVIVNPAAPVGVRDIKPTPTGQMIVNFLKGRIPAYLDTGLNLIDVEDVAEGHLLAARQGKIGERYILGNRNMSLREILQVLGEVSGIRPPRLRIPYGVALAAGWASEMVATYVTKREPLIPLTGVRLARHPHYYDTGKAIRELGLPQTPVEEALQKAVTWFRQHGYA